MTTSLRPQAVTDVQVAFPRDVSGLLPSWDSLPVDYRRSAMAGNTWGSKVFARSFYGGAGTHVRDLTPRPGIDRDMALRHLTVCMMSWESKHEHKVAGCSALIEAWFRPPKGA